ncbi:hypothetical protein [Curtobacterium sp. VKM Ac-2922]|uniref:hypothetical protein n=1 Tax=Curtobacterium sp. VKM Ac-2922 TaxID=2929475 RepID=UPI001FB3D5FA|nr:hypothetical protein [Curtobacterium sp. VKM Ac-2922]MCJ1715245.1 hypothetical protein [Curtobacterium sp. VKM Ac-2922]
MVALSFLVPIVLILVVVMILLAVHGSMQRSPLQDQQDAEWRARRAARKETRAAKRREG